MLIFEIKSSRLARLGATLDFHHGLLSTADMIPLRLQLCAELAADYVIDVAYWLIARDTIEEKILALQQTKRDLVDAVIRADESLVRNLTREDLERLLS